jgi:hypothetical protein
VESDIDLLPSFPLTAAGPVTSFFLPLGIRDFRGAARHVWRLPYGRIADRSKLSLVLTEGRGTCTTKHALLAELAAEHGVDVGLTLGIFAMDERNTPGVGAVLDAHHLACIPEAHCYLTHAGTRIDITRDVAGAAPIDTFLHEERITPAQIGDYKIALHRRFLADWLARSPAGGGRSLDDIWRIREQCIAALGEAG